jgi:hypothetical protein
MEGSLEFFRGYKYIDSAGFEVANLQYNGRHPNYYTIEATKMDLRVIRFECVVWIEIA